MAIVQISKLQARAGNLVDLPQLDNAEFGWATDENRLFIGRTGNTYSSENIEVLTSYSNISFSQINGTDGGNFNITAAQNGQILTYVQSTDTWENYTGNSSQLNGNKLQLGNVSNISMTGGAIGYVLQTDGTGNLSWTPKNSLYTTIIGLTNNTTGNIVTMTIDNTTPYTNGQLITISGANISNSSASGNINGHTFYVKLNTDYATSGNVVLYTDTGLSILANGAGLLSYTANSGIATATLGGSGGTGTVGGSNTTVQFNDQNLSNGVAGFTFDKTTTTLTVSAGNIVSGNVNANTSVTANILISNIATGTSPLTVTSTTLVPNLFVARANVSEYANTALTTTGTWYPIFVNATSGNLSQGANANLSFNAATGNLSATLFTGTLTTAAQPNITSVGTLLNTTLGSANSLSGGNLVSATYLTGTLTTAAQPNITSTGSLTFAANGNITMSGASSRISGGNLVSASYLTGTLTTAAQPNVTSLGTLTGLTVGNSTANAIFGNGTITLTSAGNLTGGNLVSASYLTGTLTTAAQPNITSVGTLTSLNVTGNITSANANVTGQIISTVATGTAPLVVSSTTQVANLNAATAGTAGTVTTAAQPNITSVGTLTSLTSGTHTVSANANISMSGSLSQISGSNLVSASYLTGTLTTAAQPNITSVSTSFTNLTFANAQTISGNNMTLTTGANTNAGTITGNWSLSTGSKLQATYADLAEYYEADKPYEPGTVVEFGGDKEVTIAEDGTTRVAGVVSTNPAYVMNSQCQGEHIVALALQGRVPVKVRGTIRKGDMLVSGGNGFARAMIHPYIGSVIGKSLANFEGEGVIEVAVGRL